MATIAEQNDEFRRHGAAGSLFITAGIAALPVETRVLILAIVRDFDTFTTDNDPYGEHDFGSFEFDEHTIFWKIDYYDQKLAMGSPDPADPAVTRRVLTVLLSQEY